LLEHLRERRVRRISLACTHGLFTGKAIQRLASQDDIDEIVITNTVPLSPDKVLPTMCVRSVAPLFAEAIRRIHLGESVSSLFDGPTVRG
jgi:ribose-phosphate pyrophosphokinase